ncbi:ubiquitin carboxyl-terminal hydrolase 42-like isoform X1 [Cyanistes caeruleus]|uniref:ubiquitin carboxyl-terminal hydrolase 42-like isoform X1 n=1 Tax=Cyanistes caeruleus TaxID=156563 RepID=UPI000CDA08B3|nr:ubiquitin carboxyl-terminal hydrolase 42-like isoform X1 [Cyanistes caeruleus]XP_023802576.1 ubiquitin carboxyl-terminal hydrolase 42-like isoform X1 [Cyanistes caeruleus]
MQRACLSASSDLDLSSESTTIVHQIFGGFLRSRVTCFSCKAISDSYEAFLDVPLDINAASSLTAALEAFVTPEQLDGENCFKCNKCTENVAASKRFTIHCAPKVLTVCLKRFDCFTGGKINKAVEYPEFLDLRPYMSEGDGEPLYYSLYAVLVHSGYSCHEGHYFCYTKASNGLWYQMDDESVEVRSIDTALGQQAYLLFYARCSDLRLGEEASSSLAPSYAPSVLSQWAACSKQVASVVPQVLPDRTKDVVLSVEDPGQDEVQSGSPLWSKEACSFVTDTTGCDDATGPPPSCGHDPIDDAASGPSNRSLELACGPGDACQETLLMQEETSSSVWSGYDLRSRFVQHTGFNSSSRKRKRETRNSPCCDKTPVDDAVPGPSSTSLKQAVMLWAGPEQTQLWWNEQRRSPEQGCDLHGLSVQCTDQQPSVTKRRRTNPPGWDKAPVDNAASGPSNISFQQACVLRAAWEQIQLRLREQRSCPQLGYDFCCRFVRFSAHHRSVRKRRVCVPQRRRSGKHSRHSRSAGGRWWRWLKQNGKLALHFLAELSMFSTPIPKEEGTI